MDVITGLTLLTQLLGQANALGDLIQRAQAEGRDITPAELDSLALADDTARDLLETAIQRAKAEDR
jgi:hypothetical protein